MKGKGGKASEKKSENKKEKKGGKNAWALFLLILVGIVLGGFLGTFAGTLADKISFLKVLNAGQTFGLDKPLVLNFGILAITFAISVKITVASMIGVVLAIIIYRFV